MEFILHLLGDLYLMIIGSEGQQDRQPDLLSGLAKS